MSDLLKGLTREDRLVWVGAGGRVSADELAGEIRRGPVDWQRVVLTAKQNRVLIPLSERLLDIPEVPAKIRAALVVHERAVHDSVRAVQTAFERALPVILRRNKILLMRGMALAYTLDRERPSRLVGVDVDLLIDRPSYPSISGRFLDHHHIPADVMAQSPPTLEYHYDLNFKSSWCVRLGKIAMGELWARRRTLRINDLEVGLLAPEDEIIYLSFHNAAKGFVGLYRFLDIARILGAHEIDWDEVIERSIRYKVAPSVWASLSVAESLTPGSVPREVLSRLAPGGLTRALVVRLLDPTVILHDPRHSDDPRRSRWSRALRKGLLFRVLLARPGTLLKIAIGPLNLLLFTLYSRADRAGLFGGLIGRTRSTLQRDEEAR